MITVGLDANLIDKLNPGLANLVMTVRGHKTQILLPEYWTLVVSAARSNTKLPDRLVRHRVNDFAGHHQLAGHAKDIFLRASD